MEKWACETNEICVGSYDGAAEDGGDLGGDAFGAAARGLKTEQATGVPSGAATAALRKFVKEEVDAALKDLIMDFEIMESSMVRRLIHVQDLRGASWHALRKADYFPCHALRFFLRRVGRSRLSRPVSRRSKTRWPKALLLLAMAPTRAAILTRRKKKWTRRMRCRSRWMQQTEQCAEPRLKWRATVAPGGGMESNFSMETVLAAGWGNRSSHLGSHVGTICTTADGSRGSFVFRFVRTDHNGHSEPICEEAAHRQRYHGSEIAVQ